MKKWIKEKWLHCLMLPMGLYVSVQSIDWLQRGLDMTCGVGVRLVIFGVFFGFAGIMGFVIAAWNLRQRSFLERIAAHNAEGDRLHKEAARSGIRLAETPSRPPKSL